MEETCHVCDVDSMGGGAVFPYKSQTFHLRILIFHRHNAVVYRYIHDENYDSRFISLVVMLKLRFLGEGGGDLTPYTPI